MFTTNQSEALTEICTATIAPAHSRRHSTRYGDMGPMCRDCRDSRSPGSNDVDVVSVCLPITPPERHRRGKVSRHQCRRILRQRLCTLVSVAIAMAVSRQLHTVIYAMPYRDDGAGRGPPTSQSTLGYIQYQHMRSPGTATVTVGEEVRLRALNPIDGAVVERL